MVLRYVVILSPLSSVDGDDDGLKILFISYPGYVGLHSEHGGFVSFQQSTKATLWKTKLSQIASAYPYLILLQNRF